MTMSRRRCERKLKAESESERRCGRGRTVVMDWRGDIAPDMPPYFWGAMNA